MTEVCIKCAVEENVDNYVDRTSEMIDVNPCTPVAIHFIFLYK